MPTRFTPPTRAALAAVGIALAGGVGAQTPATVPAAPATAAARPSPDRVVARVDGQPITEADLAVAAEDPALSIPGATDAQKRDVLINYMADLKLGAKAASDAKLAASPDFARRLSYVREKLLVDEYLDRKVKAALTPEATRAVYDETVKEMKPEEEVRARHVLVTGEDEAKAVSARLKGGEDFAKVAADLSQDPGSKADGGELGWFTRDRMVAPFGEVAFKLQPGQISEPVQTQFGWHVIQAEEKRTKPVPTFDEMKGQIEQFLTRKAQQDVVLALRSGAKVERLDESGKVIAPASPGSATPTLPAAAK